MTYIHSSYRSLITGLPNILIYSQYSH